MDRPQERQQDEALRRLAGEIRVWRQEALRGPGGLDDLTLAAYVSGELDDTARKRVEEQLGSSPELEEMVHVVRETLRRGDWQARGEEIKLDLRPPLLVASARPVGRTPVLARLLRARRWTGAAAALAAAAVVAVAIWQPSKQTEQREPSAAAPRPGTRAEPPAALALRVYSCSLDAQGQVIRREPLPPGELTRPGGAFQVQVASREADRFCLLHVDTLGKVASLHTSARPAAAPEKIVLPSPDRAYRLDEASGVESFLVVRTDAPQQLVAKAQNAVNEIQPPTMLARLAREKAVNRRPPIALSKSVGRKEPGLGEKAAEVKGLPEPSQRLGAAQVRDLVQRLRRDYDVSGFVVIQHKPR